MGESRPGAHGQLKKGQSERERAREIETERPIHAGPNCGLGKAAEKVWIGMQIRPHVEGLSMPGLLEAAGRNLPAFTSH